jgi:hypothetical protein
MTEEYAKIKIKGQLQWEDDKIEKWFSTESPFFGGMTPRQFLELRPEKFDKILTGLLSGA